VAEYDIEYFDTGGADQNFDGVQPRIFDLQVFPIAPALLCRMRGYDTTLTSVVFWFSDHVDATATDYGGPGPVTEIIVQKKIGSQ